MNAKLGESTIGEMLPLFIIGLLLFLTIIFLFSGTVRAFKNSKRAKRDKKQKDEFLKQQGVTANVTLKYIDGLPLASGVDCEISSYPNQIKITGNNTEFNLDKSLLVDVCIKTDVEIQNQYVSSVGGAVAGAILFGGLGAIVGGRAKQKETRISSNYLIFTYSKNDEIKYISFEVPPYLKQASLFVKEFKTISKKKTIVDL